MSPTSRTPDPDPLHADAGSLTDRLAAGLSAARPPAPDPTVAGALGAGRRALRRRRVLVSSGVAAAVVALGLGATTLGGGSPRQVGLDPADQSGAVSPPEATPAVTYEGSYVPQFDGLTLVPATSGQDVELLADGSVAVAEGVTVIDQVPDPLGYRLPDRSLGLAFRSGDGEDGGTTWALLTYREDRRGRPSSSTTTDPARKSFATLQQWLDDQVALQQGEQAPLQFVEFAADSGDDETLQPLPGVEILQQSADVELGDGFAGPGDPTAVAEVRVDDQRWYVLARRIAGSDPEYFPTAARVGGADLGEFLAYAATVYAEGGGGLR